MPAQAPVVIQSGSVAAPIFQSIPGGSVTAPQYVYPGGSVEVPVFGQQVSVQRLYQRIGEGTAPVTTPQPITYSGGGLTPEQLKLIFPMGAPENFTPSVAVAPPAPVVVSSVAQVVSAPAPIVSALAAPAVVPAADAMPAADGAAASGKAAASKKKSGKKKLSKKKRSGTGCC